MKPAVLLFLGLLIAGIVSPAAATPRGPSTMRERLMAVRYARSLELRPLAPDSVRKRQWMTEFLVNVPDLKINVCENVIGAQLQAANQNYNRQLAWQYVYSSAAFMIQHPNVKDPVKIQTAGVEGALRAYSSIVRVDRNMRFGFLEELLARKRNGRLQDYVAGATLACRETGKTDSADKTPGRLLVE